MIGPCFGWLRPDRWAPHASKYDNASPHVYISGIQGFFEALTSGDWFYQKIATKEQSMV